MSENSSSASGAPKVMLTDTSGIRRTLPKAGRHRRDTAHDRDQQVPGNGAGHRCHHPVTTRAS